MVNPDQDLVFSNDYKDECTAICKVNVYKDKCTAVCKVNNYEDECTAVCKVRIDGEKDHYKKIPNK